MAKFKTKRRLYVRHPREELITFVIERENHNKVFVLWSLGEFAAVNSDYLIYCQECGAPFLDIFAGEYDEKYRYENCDYCGAERKLYKSPKAVWGQRPFDDVVKRFFDPSPEAKAKITDFVRKRLLIGA